MKLWMTALIALGLAGCSSLPVEHYANEKPALDLKTYLNGTLDAWGIFQGRSGEVKKLFHVVIDAQWEGDNGTLDEHFTWSDGTTSRRVWKLKALGNGRFSGTAHDVVGEAAGQSAGNALQWKYVLAVPVDGKTWHVDMDDWMYLMDDRVMMNRTTMRKWGFRVGEISLTFVKR